MKRCERCGIDLTGDLDLCPLCQGPLTGTASPATFPGNQVHRSGTMALRVLAFATGVGVLAMVFAGFLFGLSSDVVLAVCLALLTNFVFVRHFLAHAPDFLRLVVRYFLVLLAAAALWYLVGRNPVVTTYVIPAICLVALVTDAVLVCVFRGTFVSGYAKYLLLDVLLGIVPLGLVALGLTTRAWPAATSAFVACVLLLALVVFARERLTAEIRKLFTA